MDSGLALRAPRNDGEKNPPHHQQIKQQRAGLPDRERHAIRQLRQGAGDEQKIRRIVPAIERRRFAEDFLLAGVLSRRIEWDVRLAFEHISAGRIDVGEIGSERAALAINVAMRGHDQERESRDRGDEHRGSDQPDALAGQPVAVSQRLPRPGHRGSCMDRKAAALGQRTLNGALRGEADRGFRPVARLRCDWRCFALACGPPSP